MTATKTDEAAALIEQVARCAQDPLRFVMLAYPWGCRGTEIAGAQGPYDWQREALKEIRDGLARKDGPVLVSVASGHGVGKSALVAWAIDWAMSTCVDTRGIVTANTENQLRTKTWAELAKWRRMSLTSGWFRFTATSLMSAEPGRDRTWRMDAVPWSESNTEAFAGLHNAGKRLLIVFDEASAIPDVIWEVTEGALTDADTEIIWLAFGNPTRNTGRFRDCFGKLRHRWKTRHVDARSVPGTNKAQHDNWIADYGADSDFVRVRVLGEFPRAGSTQFIATDVVEAAMSRPHVETGPAVLGVDIARFGDDQTVCVKRRGQATEVLFRVRGLDTMQTAARIAEQIDEHGPKATFIDGVGVGGGVVDRLRQLGYQVVDVNGGSKPVDAETYFNHRAEMWGLMRSWLSAGGALPPKDHQMSDDLTGPEYGFDGKNRIQLERKEDMKKRGLASPDCADALALTFAAPVHAAPARKIATHSYAGPGGWMA